MSAGYEVVEIGEVADVIAGQSPPGSSYNTEGEGTPFYQGKKRFTNENIGKPEKWTTAPNKIALSGDVLMSVRAPVGPVNFATGECCIGRGLAALRARDSLSPKYLFYYLRSIERKIAGSEGAVFPSINLEQIRKIPIPLPSYDEQRRIVAILDDAFTGLDRIRQNIETNLVSAEELFSGWTALLFKNPDWAKVAVGDVLTLQRGFDITKRQQNPGDIPVVSSGGPLSLHDEAKTEGPAVIIGRKGSIGSVYYEPRDCWPHDTTLWVKDFKGNNPRLVFQLLRSLDLKALDSGAANPSLNRNLVHPIIVRWPVGENQAAIASEIDKLETKVRALCVNYKAKRHEVSELRQSILQRAFAGELT